MNPVTRKEKFLAKAAGEFDESLPTPVTREEHYLKAIAENSGGGGFTPTEEQLTAMNSGIDSEKVAQIATNTQNISGKQDTIDSSHKLNSDLVDDTNQNNKFVTSSEKTKIANALTEEVYNAGKQVITNNKTGEIFNDYTTNKATENYSHAEGGGTTASGTYSHAEGGGTTASGTYSHAEGSGTTASGTCSHAEGSGSKATGYGSHAEGGGSKATGYGSHAEGGSTTASGTCSHAEGIGTTASGICSHAEGSGTITSSDYQHAQGKFNIEDSSGKYAFIIGNGTNPNNRSNAFAVDWLGKIYVNNSATGVNVSQLQPIIDSTNKISADLVDDSNSTNKFVTSAEKATWSAKQSALTSAQLTAVNSGIDSSKVTQIEKNNSALIGLIDSGPKNLIDAQNPSSQQRVTITNGSNGAINISCDSAAWATTTYIFNIEPNVDYSLSVYIENPNLSSVKCMLFVNDYNNNELHRETITNSTSQAVFVINSQTSENKLSFNINNSATAGSGSATIRMMLCSKAAWDISQKYVPCRPSYDELVARITALENA